MFRKVFLALILLSFVSRTNLAYASVAFAAENLSAMYSDDDKDDDEDNDDVAYAIFLLALVAAAGIGVAYYWMNSVQFLDYPYQETGEDYPGDEKLPGEGNYIMRGNFEDLFTHSDPGYCSNRFSIDTSFVWLNEIGLGAESRFEGLFFPYFGPYFENMALCNFQEGDFRFNEKGFRDNLKLGGQLSLFQSNFISATFLLAYTNWFGDSFDDYNNGVYAGALLRSYPVKPLVLEWKFGWQFYSGDFNVFESNLQVGAMAGKTELFAAWKVLSFDYDGDDFYWHMGNFHGLTLGFRRYFNMGTNL